MKTFKAGDRIEVIKYISDPSIIGLKGTVLTDSKDNKFEEVKLDTVKDTMYFWYTEIEKIYEA